MKIASINQALARGWIFFGIILISLCVNIIHTYLWGPDEPLEAEMVDLAAISGRDSLLCSVYTQKSEFCAGIFLKNGRKSTLGISPVRSMQRWVKNAGYLVSWSIGVFAPVLSERKHIRNIPPDSSPFFSTMSYGVLGDGPCAGTHSMPTQDSEKSLPKMSPYRKLSGQGNVTVAASSGIS